VAHLFSIGKNMEPRMLFSTGEDPSMKFRYCRLFLMMLMLAASLYARADSYDTAGFSGGVSWANGFDNLSWGPTVSGTFVYDNSLIPGVGSGYQNVFFSTFPDIANIPSATAFQIELSPTLSFDLSNALTDPWNQYAAIQYNNGAFNGFFFDALFQNSGNTYLFDDEGGSWTIYNAPGGINNFQPVASGYINIGNSGVTNPTPYTPAPSVPEPGSLALLGSGVIGLAGMLRRKIGQRV